MAASHVNCEAVLREGDIPGAKLAEDINLLTKSEAIRWLRRRGCTNLGQLHLKDLQNK